jgi:hypothetical protein
MIYPCKFLTPTGMNKSDTTNFIRAFVAIFKHMKYHPTKIPLLPGAENYNAVIRN